MNILAINTAFSGLQIAISVRGKEFVSKNLPLKSSENVLVKTEQMLAEAGIEISDVDVIGVVIGPGSFTGLRVGAALVKGICAVQKNTKVCAVGSMELMAWVHKKNGAQEEFCAVQNALGGRFFVQDFDQNGLPLGEARLVMNLSTLHKIGLAEERLSEVQEFVNVNSQHLLDVVKMHVECGDFVSAEKLAPVYLRLSQAEENLLKKEDVNA